jgi:hypothetical protein
MLFWPDVHEREANDESQNMGRPEGAVDEMLAGQGQLWTSRWCGQAGTRGTMKWDADVDWMPCDALLLGDSPKLPKARAVGLQLAPTSSLVMFTGHVQQALHSVRSNELSLQCK